MSDIDPFLAEHERVTRRGLFRAAAGAGLATGMVHGLAPGRLPGAEPAADGGPPAAGPLEEAIARLAPYFTPAGDFRCSNDLVNRIHSNIRWTQRAYLRSVPMEPDRDERMGWLGTQAKDFESNACNFDVAALLGKWLQDIRLDQLPDGHLPDVSPTYWAMYNSGIVWPSNIAILPEIMYDLYGDRRALEANYPALTLWLKFISRHLKPDATVDLKKFGDWCDAYSIDGGQSWRGAKLGADMGRYSFREFTFVLTPEKGAYDLRVRAWNRSGQSQPMDALWQPAGYMRNVVESVKVTAA